MSKILDCTMSDCSYNKNKECHTMAITIGGAHAMCGTLLKAAQKGGVDDMTAGVGACQIANCKYNRNLECTASGIHVGMHSEHADCITFATA